MAVKGIKEEEIMKDRLVVPTNNFNLWRINAPNLKVARLSASTEFKSTATVKKDFEFKGIKLGSIESTAINRLNLSYIAEGYNTALSLTDIARAMMGAGGITDLYMHNLTYYKEVKDKPYDDCFYVTFDCFTPHRNQDRKRIANSTTYPDEQLYILQDEIKSKFGKAKYDKSSVMILKSITPQGELVDDLDFIRKIEYNFMFHYYMRARDWKLVSSQFRKHSV